MELADDPGKVKPPEVAAMAEAILFAVGKAAAAKTRREKSPTDHQALADKFFAQAKEFKQQRT